MLLIVGNCVFDIFIGIGNIILVLDDISYIKEFVVFVLDSVG